MMLSPPPELRVLDRFQVAPPPGAVAESSLPLTFFDIGWLYGGTVERVFFYSFPYSTSHFTDSVLSGLKSSLSLALQLFYPLAGKVRHSPGSEDKYEIHYVDGHSVPFTLVEHDGDFDDLSRSHARELNRLLPLLPQLPKPDDDGNPLLALQVTVFPNKGVAIGITVHHAGCDGSGSMHFMCWWASTCAGSVAAATATPPIFDRSMIPDPNGRLYSIIFKNLVTNAGETESMMNQAAPPGAVIGAFTLTGEHIRRMKELVSAKAKAMEGGASVHCSAIVVTYAYAWVCIVKTQALASDRVAHLAFATDCRGRIRPPVPAAYFGNCVGGCFVKEKAGDLLGEEGVVKAAVVIGKAVEQFKQDDPLEEAGGWPEKYKSIAFEQPLSFAGSPRFRVYDMDFGWGRPKQVEIASIFRTGAMSVAESRGGGGGVQLGLVLPKQVMDAFGDHFSNGLKTVMGQTR